MRWLRIAFAIRGLRRVAELVPQQVPEKNDMPAWGDAMLVYIVWLLIGELPPFSNR